MKTIYKKYQSGLIVKVLLLCMVMACKKADNFKATLDTTPQISNEQQFAYLPAYAVGDTLNIVGAFKPIDNLKINIGDVDNAPILIRDSVLKVIAGSGGDKFTKLDRIRVIITGNMGIGPNKQVVIDINGAKTIGHNIEIFDKYGSESFKQPLQLVSIGNISDIANVFLQCINGKGDLYWFDQSTQTLIHKTKAGNNTTIATAVQIQQALPGFTKFVAGGVNPQGTKIWFSVQADGTNQFAELNISTQKITLLNKGLNTSSAYEGNVITVNLPKITGVYAGSKGNVFLRVTDGDNYAIAEYNETQASIRYILKSPDHSSLPSKPYPGLTLPTEINENYSFSDIRLLPEENLLYLFGTKAIMYQGTLSTVSVIQPFDLGAQSKLTILHFLPVPENYLGVGKLYPVYTGPFNDIRIDKVSVLTNTLFGWLPMPGQRLQSLFYQYFDGGIGNMGHLFELPKWMIFNFKKGYSYLYAPGRLEIKDYIFGPYYDPNDRDNPRTTNNVDELLNYDEEGQLYMTGNGRALILKTTLK